MVLEPLDFFLQFCIRSVMFKTGPNTEALGTLLKAQNPGNDLKSTEMETLRNGAQNWTIFKSLPGTLSTNKKEAVSQARPIEYALTEVPAPCRTLPSSPGALICGPG